MDIVISAESSGKHIKQLGQCVAGSTVELPKGQEAIGKRRRRDKYVSISVLCVTMHSGQHNGSCTIKELYLNLPLNVNFKANVIISQVVVLRPAVRPS